MPGPWPRPWPRPWTRPWPRPWTRPCGRPPVLFGAKRAPQKGVFWGAFGGTFWCTFSTNKTPSGRVSGRPLKTTGRVLGCFCASFLGGGSWQPPVLHWLTTRLQNSQLALMILNLPTCGHTDEKQTMVHQCHFHYQLNEMLKVLVISVNDSAVSAGFAAEASFAVMDNMQLFNTLFM